MARIPLAPQSSAPDQDQDPENVQHPRVLSFPSAYTQRRDDVCAALRGLADAWEKLSIRDEAAWSAFAADAGLSLARYLLQHAADVRAAMLERGHRAGREDGSPAADEVPRSARSSGADHESPSTGTEAEADRAADAAVLALVGLTCALGADNAEEALLHIAVGTGAARVVEPKADVRRSSGAARQVS